MLIRASEWVDSTSTSTSHQHQRGGCLTITWATPGGGVPSGTLPGSGKHKLPPSSGSRSDKKRTSVINRPLYGKPSPLRERGPGRKYGTPVSGWKQQLGSRIGVSNNNRAASAAAAVASVRAVGTESSGIVVEGTLEHPPVHTQWKCAETISCGSSLVLSRLLPWNLLCSLNLLNTLPLILLKRLPKWKEGCSRWLMTDRELAAPGGIFGSPSFSSRWLS